MIDKVGTIVNVDETDKVDGHIFYKVFTGEQEAWFHQSELTIL